MSLDMAQKELTDEIVQSLKEKYETDPQKMTTQERFLLMVAATAQYLDDWDRYKELLSSFTDDVNARIRQVDKLIGMYELDKIDHNEMWSKWIDLIPDSLEDMLQSLGGVGYTLLQRIYNIRHRLVQVDEKKPSPPIPDRLIPHEKLEIERQFLRSKGMTDGPELEREAQRRQFLKSLMGDTEFQQRDAEYIDEHGHGMGTTLAIK